MAMTMGDEDVPLPRTFDEDPPTSGDPPATVNPPGTNGLSLILHSLSVMKQQNSAQVLPALKPPAEATFSLQKILLPPNRDLRFCGREAELTFLRQRLCRTDKTQTYRASWTEGASTPPNASEGPDITETAANPVTTYREAFDDATSKKVWMTGLGGMGKSSLAKLANADRSHTMVVALTGMGGIGKSSVAKEFVYRNCDSFDAIFWVTGDTHAGIASSFAKIAKNLQLPGAGEPTVAMRDVFDWLFRTKKTWLMVVDDLDDPDLMKWPWTTLHGSIIITSRRPQIAADIGQCEVLSLDTFSDIDGAAFLSQLSRTEIDDGDDENDEAAALQVSAMMGGLPVALRSLAEKLRKLSLTPRRLLQFLQRRSTSGLANDRIGRLLSGPVTGFSVLQVCDSAFAVLSETASSLLGILAYLDPNMTPFHLLRILGDDEIHCSMMDEYDLEEGLADLQSLALIKVDSAKTNISVHGLVQDAYRAFMIESNRSRSLVRAAKLLSTYCCRPLDLEDFTRSRALILLEGLKRFAQDDDGTDTVVAQITRAREALTSAVEIREHDQDVSDDSSDGDSDDVHSRIYSSMSDVGNTRASSFTSMSLHEPGSGPSNYSDDQIALALLTDKGCRSTLETLSLSVESHRLERGIAAFLYSLAWDFRKYADGEKDLELFNFVLQRHELVASSIARIIEGPKCPANVQGPDEADTAICQQDGSLVMLLASPVVPIFVERLGKLNANKVERAPLDEKAPLDEPQQVSAVFSCPCGSKVQDWYYERVPGSVEETMREFKAAYRAHASGSSSQPTLPLTNTPSNPSSTHVRWSVPNAFSWLKGVGRSRDSGPDPPTPGHTAQSQTVQPKQAPRWLFLCITQDRIYRRTDKRPLCFVFDTDEALFRRLRQEFDNALGWWRRFMMIKKVSTVRFVQFRMLGNIGPDVVKHSQMLSGYEASLPPKTNRDYELTPNPADHWPPVGHELMQHFVYCPAALGDSEICKQRFPKQISHDLSSTGSSHDVFGWGIELIEGRYWKFLFVPLLLVLVLSTIFGVIWAVFKKDISGGFAVASYMVAALTLLVGTIEVVWDQISRNNSLLAERARSSTENEYSLSSPTNASSSGYKEV